MYKQNCKSNYDPYPQIALEGFDGASWSGYPAIGRELAAAVQAVGRRCVVVVECYPAVREAELLAGVGDALAPVLVLHAEDAALEEALVTEKMQRFLTDDRVFGYRSPFAIEEFFHEDKIAAMRREIDTVQTGVVLVYGFGASLIADGDLLVYANLARWEIQQRYRSGEMGNWQASNREEDPLRKYKRGFFVEWRMADRFKRGLYDRIDYLLDTNRRDDPAMLTGEAYRAGLVKASTEPFRLVPYFDPGVWGGQWMQEVFGLPKRENYAWSFDGVPEENSLYLQCGSVRAEIPAIDAVLYRPRQLLGEQVYARFGAEFPIRFDLLDTMEGQNLSLQVHPLTEYIQEQFGMHYTQDESYYILDAEEDACIYLGLREGIDRQAMFRDLETAQAGGADFPADRYVHRLPAKRHDHFAIPAGTIHCSGKGSMVLEISATPYIFTFKLWDWGRVGLDGLPRPTHIEHGRQVIQWDRDAGWVDANLSPRTEPLSSGDGWRLERTGLHTLEFIETRRYWITGTAPCDTGGGFQMLNLVSGREAVIESPEGLFAPFVLHYAETMILPAAVGRYTIRPHGESEGNEIGVIQAYVRG